jgi:hypothetical protein
MVKKSIVSEVMAAMGRKGGRAVMRSMTPEQRTERARIAGKARQAKARAAKKGGKP